jgi:nucleoside phosphorylase
VTFRDGDAQFDCLAILDALYKPYQPLTTNAERASRWGLLWQDLQVRSRALEGAIRRKVLDAALASQLPVDLRPADWRSRITTTTSTTGGKRLADVLIFCVLEEEFNATLAAFGINQREVWETDTIFGHRFYQISLQNQFCGGLSVWIGLIGEARNVVCANFCRDAFEVFDVRHCCILVGIAAGFEEKVGYADVAAAHIVWDDEGGRVEPGRIRPRPEPYRLRPPWRELFRGFNPARTRWLDGRGNAIDLLRATGAVLPSDAEDRQIKYVPGVIIAGEKLRRDEPFAKLTARYGDEVVALEMEGSGFAATCERMNHRWLVFRGISDYGDMRKRDEWQALAALHAALAAKNFITAGLRSLSRTSLG